VTESRKVTVLTTGFGREEVLGTVDRFQVRTSGGVVFQVEETDDGRGLRVRGAPDSLSVLPECANVVEVVSREEVSS